MGKRKIKDTGARADVLEWLVRMRLWLEGSPDSYVSHTWLYPAGSAGHSELGHSELAVAVRSRLLAFVRPGYPQLLTAYIDWPHADHLRWLDTVIAHDTRELESRRRETWDAVVSTGRATTRRGKT